MQLKDTELSDPVTYVDRIAYNAKGQKVLTALGNGIMTRYLYRSDNFRLLRMKSEGYEKTITSLGNINILNSTFGDYLVVSAAENTFFKTIDENRSNLTFRQIGGTTNFMSGIGSLRSVYNFKNSDFSFTPKEVEIRVIGNYSSLAQGDRGYLNIYLNGMLINTEMNRHHH